MGEPSGPMLKGTTYIVRPRMEPSKRPSSVSRISLGSHPVVGGAGVVLRRRADEGAVLDARHVRGIGPREVRIGAQLLVRACGTCRRRRARAHRRSYSASEPSHQWMRGWVSSATSSTHASSLRLSVDASVVAVLDSLKGSVSSSVVVLKAATPRESCPGAGPILSHKRRKRCQTATEAA